MGGLVLLEVHPSSRVAPRLDEQVAVVDRVTAGVRDYPTIPSMDAERFRATSDACHR
jgi:hypothetical protein